jgi:putative transposase
LAHPDLSVRRQCELLGVNRAGLYYQPRGESEENLRVMRLLDEQYTRTPFYGRRRMRVWLQGQGYDVNPKRVARLMDLIGIAAIYPKPKLSVPGEGHKIYPYLLEGVQVNRVNQVWSTDITYIRMAQGFVYLVAVMDWFSRFVLSWALSVTMEVPFCIEALEKALGWGRPEIFNSDQGSQFTSEKFTGVLKGRDIAVSMDGRGRCLDKHFHRTVVAFAEITKRCTYGITDWCRRLGRASAVTSSSTITNGRIRAWSTERRRISTRAGG